MIILYFEFVILIRMSDDFNYESYP